MRLLITGLVLVAGVLCAQSKPCQSDKLPKFSDFTVHAVFSGKPKQPILTTKLEHLYRTTIREAAMNGTNFAGHFAIAEWGCGTGCHDFVVVDVRTGKVYDPPFRDLNFHMPPPDLFVDSDPNWFCFADVIRYRKDSDLLVVEGCLDDKQCGRTYFRMVNTGLKQVAFDPDLLPDGKVAPF